MSAPAAPEGIESRHIYRAEGSTFRQWPWGSAALGVLLTLSFFGVYGDVQKRSHSGEEVQFVVEGPSVIRNGEFFEMMLTVEARRDIQNLSIRVEADLWRDMTVNTLLPDPSEQSFANGAFVLEFGMLDAGKNLLVKIDGQVNPSHGPSANEGVISIADDRTTLASVNFNIEVLP